MFNILLFSVQGIYPCDISRIRRGIIAKKNEKGTEMQKARSRENARSRNSVALAVDN